MLLRVLVNNFVRQAAQQKLGQAVSQVARRVSEASQPMVRERPVDGDAPPQLAPCDVAILFALPIESGGLADRLRDRVTTRCHSYLEHTGWLGDRPVLVAETGEGREQSARAAEDIVTLYKPAWLISAGFAGALDESLGRGFLLMVDQVADMQGNRLDVGLTVDRDSLSGQRGVGVGRLLSLDEVTRDRAERLRLAQEYGAVACDMETMAIAQVCQRSKTRFLGFRIITDLLDDELPVEMTTVLGQKSLAGKLGAAAGALFHRPSAIKDMWKLREDALSASDRLAKFLERTLPQLP